MTSEARWTLQLGLTPDDERWLRTMSQSGRIPGLPNEAQVRDRLRSFELLAEAAPDLLAQINETVLGPAWWNDIDIVPCDRAPDGSDAEQTGDTGCGLGDRLTLRNLAALFTLIGAGADGASEYAVVDDGRVVGRIDLGASAGGTPLERLQRRVHRRLRPDVRDVLELRALTRGAAVNSHDSFLAEIARLEHELSAPFAGADTVLDVYRRAGLPDGMRRTSWALGRGQRLLRQWLRRPFVVALSGVDGSGKSSSARLLIEYLDRVGIDSASVWSRPGNRMEWTEFPLALLGLKEKGAKPAVATVAEGGTAAQLASRKGVVGWVWLLLVTGTYLFDVWAQYLRYRTARIIVFDRHLVDATVTLDFVYAGVDLTLSRWLCRLVPRADITFYLAIDAETATARKPGDTFGLHAVATQLERYGSELDQRPDIVTVENVETPERRALILFDHLAGHQDVAG